MDLYIGLDALSATSTAVVVDERSRYQVARDTIELVLGGRALRLKLADGEEVHRRALQAHHHQIHDGERNDSTRHEELQIRTAEHRAGGFNLRH